MVKGRDIICKLDSVPILPRKLSRPYYCIIPSGWGSSLLFILISASGTGTQH